MVENETKRKLYVITQSYPYGDGEKTFLEPELKRLCETRKFDITIISNPIKGSKRTSEVDKDIKVICIPEASLKEEPILSIKYGVLYFFSKSTKLERKEILKEGMDLGKIFDSVIFYIRAGIFYRNLLKMKLPMNQAIIYTYWCNVQTLALALHKDEFEGIKLVSRIHGFDLYDERMSYGRQPFRRILDNQLERLFFIAQTGLEYYTNKIGVIDPNKYVLRRLGTEKIENYNRIVQEPEKKTSFLIVSCSSIISVKRIELIIRALKQIEEFDITWVHFGDGIERESIEKQAFEVLSPKKNIQYEFKGQTDNKEILSFYQNNFVDSFITTSRSEGCPVSIQEAMSLGLPIIATAVGEIPNMIAGNGILLSENPTPEETADAIRKLHSMSGTEIDVMRKCSYALWKQYFDADKNYKVFAEDLVNL